MLIEYHRSRSEKIRQILGYETIITKVIEERGYTKDGSSLLADETVQEIRLKLTELINLSYQTFSHFGININGKNKNNHTINIGNQERINFDNLNQNENNNNNNRSEKSNNSNENNKNNNKEGNGNNIDSNDTSSTIFDNQALIVNDNFFDPNSANLRSSTSSGKNNDNSNRGSIVIDQDDVDDDGVDVDINTNVDSNSNDSNSKMKKKKKNKNKKDKKSKKERKKDKEKEKESEKEKEKEKIARRKNMKAQEMINENEIRDKLRLENTFLKEKLRRLDGQLTNQTQIINQFRNEFDNQCRSIRQSLDDVINKGQQKDRKNKSISNRVFNNDQDRISETRYELLQQKINFMKQEKEKLEALHKKQIKELADKLRGWVNYSKKMEQRCKIFQTQLEMLKQKTGITSKKLKRSASTSSDNKNSKNGNNRAVNVDPNKSGPYVCYFIFLLIVHTRNHIKGRKYVLLFVVLIYK